MLSNQTMKEDGRVRSCSFGVNEKYYRSYDRITSCNMTNISPISLVSRMLPLFR